MMNNYYFTFGFERKGLYPHKHATVAPFLDFWYSLFLEPDELGIKAKMVGCGWGGRRLKKSSTAKKFKGAPQQPMHTGRLN